MDTKTSSLREEIRAILTHNAGRIPERLETDIDLIVQAVRDILPARVPKGPVDVSDEAINSLPWETGHNQVLDEINERLK